MAASTGINRETGAPLSDLDHVIQSVIVIWTTTFGERVRNENFGSYIPDLLGNQNLTRGPLLRFFAALILSIELWEPRLRIRQIVYPPAPTNSEVKLRVGQFGFTIIAVYRPYALQGDTTTDARLVVI